MAKIKFKYWKSRVEGAKLPHGGFFIEGNDAYQISNAPGRAMGHTKCPCCEGGVDFYIWSMAGSGKRCPRCNVLIFSSGVILKQEELTEDVEVVHIKDNRVLFTYPAPPPKMVRRK